MKRTLLLLLCVAVGFTVNAKEITRQQALQKAQQFMKGKQFTAVTNRSQGQNQTQEPQGYYVFNAEHNGGFVIVAGDDRMPAVLGYSLEGRYVADSIPCNMRAWLDMYAAQVAYLQSHPEAEAEPADTVQGEAVSPMLDCTWGQGEPYNSQCPKYHSQYTVTGCVATAIAQILYYHRWPKQTSDVIPGYKTSTYKISVPDTPVTRIDWENMLPDYRNSDYTATQANAVATLMKLCGVAMMMDYGPNSSSSSLSMDKLCQYFDYDEQCESFDRYGSGMSQTEWNQMVYDELALGRPVYYSGTTSSYSGHAFVIDGYEGNNYFHVNWGWGGSGNGAYLLSNLLDYNAGQICIKGICPVSTEEPRPYAVLQNGVLTFYYDQEKSSRSGQVFPTMKGRPWNEYGSKITKVVFDPTFAGYAAKSYDFFFTGCEKVTSIEGLSYLNTSSAEDLSYLFANCSSLKEIDLGGFQTGNAKLIRGMFFNCSSLTSLDLSSFDTRNVVNMESMFYHCASLQTLDIGHFDTRKVTNMLGLFSECESIKYLNLSSFVTDSVTSMQSFFQNCSSLTRLDVSGFHTERVKDMYSMFEGCSSLPVLDLGSFKIDHLKDMGNMFRDCSSLKTIYATEGWCLDSLESHSYEVFSGCPNIVGGKGSSYRMKESVYDNPYMIDRASSYYARIDEGPELPGFFTSKEEALKAYEEGQLVYARYDSLAKADSLALYEQALLQKTQNESLSDSLLLALDHLKTLIVQSGLDDEHQSAFGQQLNVLADDVNQLKVENAVYSISSDSLQKYEVPMAAFLEQLTAFGDSIRNITIPGEELDSVVTAFLEVVANVRSSCLNPMETGYAKKESVSMQLITIAGLLNDCQVRLDDLSKEILFVVSGIKPVEGAAESVIVYTLDGKRRAAKVNPSKPSGVYIMKGKKYVLN